MQTNPSLAGLGVTLCLRIRVADGQRSELLDFLRKAIPFYEKQGGVKARLLQRLQDPDSFLEIMEYEDYAAYERDQRRVENDIKMKEYLTKWRGLLSGEVTVEAYYDLTGELMRGGGS